MNAIEVVNAFEGLDGLLKFKHWVESPDQAFLARVETSGRARGRRGVLRGQHGKGGGGAEEVEVAGGCEQVDALGENGEDAAKGEDHRAVHRKVFQSKHRGVSKNWILPNGFPSDAVVEAYLQPKVDDSTEKFTWGRPDLEALRLFCQEKLAFTREKADELLLPVLKVYESHETQLRLEAFYTFNQRFAKVRSKRIQKALTGITGKSNSEIMDLPLSPPKAVTTRKGKAGRKHVEAPNVIVENSLNNVIAHEGPMEVAGKGDAPVAGQKRRRKEYRQTAAGRDPNEVVRRKGPLKKKKRGSDGNSDEPVKQGKGSQHDSNVAAKDQNSSERKTTVARQSQRRKKPVKYFNTISDNEGEPDTGASSHSSDYEPERDDEGEEGILRDSQDGSVEILASRQEPGASLFKMDMSQDVNLTMPVGSLPLGESTEWTLASRDTSAGPKRQNSDYLFSGGGFCLEEEGGVGPQDESREEGKNGDDMGQGIAGDVSRHVQALSYSKAQVASLTEIGGLLRKVPDFQAKENEVIFFPMIDRGKTGTTEVDVAMSRTGVGSIEHQFGRDVEGEEEVEAVRTEAVIGKDRPKPEDETRRGRLKAAPLLKRKKKHVADSGTVSTDGQHWS